MALMDKSRSFKLLFICIAVVLVLVFAARVWFAAEKMPQLEYKLVDGSVLSMDGLQNKVVVFSFWSTSCGSCIAEMPHLVKMYEEYGKQGFEIVAIALAQDQLRDVVRLVYDKKLPYKVAYDADGRTAQAWGGIEYTPTVFIVNRKGQVIARMVGGESAEIETVIKTLLQV